MSLLLPRRAGAHALVAAALAALAASAAPLSARAATLPVPSPQYPTVQAAVDAAGRNGDTIDVAGGRYVERLSFGTKNVILQGAGAAVTTIESPTGTSGPTVDFGTSSSTLRGFTITGGRNYQLEGGGILIGSFASGGGTSVIEDCVIEGNVAGSGAGIAVAGGSATIRRSVVRDNVEGCGSGCKGGGILVSSSSPGTVISGNVIERNTSETGAGIAVTRGNPLIEGNVIRGNLGDPVNGGTQGGEGLYLGTVASAKVVGNLFEGNERGGIVVNTFFSSDTALIVNNTIAANGMSSASALVLKVDGGNVEVVNNVLTGAGPAVSCFGSYPATAVFRNNTVWAPDGNHVTGCALSGGASTGNVTSDPVLVDPEYQNFRLRTASPAVDAGSATMPTGVTLPSVDLDGLPRVVGGTVDRGAYEYQGLTAVSAPVTVDFGPQRVGTTSAARTVTFTNAGTVPLNVTDVSISGEYAFTSSCRGPDGIAPGQSCTATVTFQPLARLARPGALVLRGNVGQLNGVPAAPAGEIAATVQLTGTGSAPHVVLSRDAIAFGTQRVGRASAPQQLVLTNDGEVELVLASIGAGAPYQVSQVGCVAVAPNGGTCAIGITFWPAARGSFAGTLTIASDAINAPNTVALSGQGVAPVVSVSPPSLDLGDLRVGESAPERTATLSNVGDAPLVISSVVVTGTGFAGASDCPESLAPTASCTLRAAFTSSAAGAASGAITASHDAIGGQTRIGLSASVHDFMVVVTGADPTVPRGATATYALVVSRAGSFDPYDYPVTLSCSGAPAGCVFSPSQTVTPGYQTTVTMQVPVPVNASVPGGTASLGLVLLPVSALALGSRRRRGALLALVLLAVAAGTACDGGKGGIGPPGPATYTITVTATSGSLVHTDTATLYVR